jgi:hypothetical protein
MGYIICVKSKILNTWTLMQQSQSVVQNVVHIG